MDDCIFAVFILCFATPDFLEHVCIGGAGRSGAGEDIVQYGVVQRLAVADAGDGGAGIRADLQFAAFALEEQQITIATELCRALMQRDVGGMEDALHG